jgi:putative ATP-dependent endonuclease of the OLD family
MHLMKIIIHNLRSVKDTSFEMEKYSLLIGENNSGKTNIITALRLFYEDSIKFEEKIDFPKFETDDNDSWVELEFLTTEEEQVSLKREYQNSNRLLRVRKYFKSDTPDLVKPAQSNIYAYENDKLSSNLFYGAKNISQAKLGTVIYIPELSKMEDNVKMSGPSPLRDMINFVMKKIVKSSPSFAELQTAFGIFNTQFKEEASKDGFSLSNIGNDINAELEDWGIKFTLDINSIAPEDIVKNLITHDIKDTALGNKSVSAGCYGQGLQRHLIYTLIRLSAKYIDKKVESKKEWSPDYTLILFEEPEAFLHPTQQENINLSLVSLANESSQQILITTHSPIFVSKNIDQLPSLLKASRIKGKTNVFQINKDEIKKLFDSNNSMFTMFTEKLSDPTVPDAIKKIIKNKGLGDPEIDIKRKIEEESIKYFLWLDSNRAISFFARHVIICEGASEKILLDHLFDSIWKDCKGYNIYCLDAMGKFNIHRYMNLFQMLGISHAVLYDKDEDDEIQKLINDFINSSKNEFTTAFVAFDDTIETFLGLPEDNSRKDLKPLSIMWHYFNGKIEIEKLKKLREHIESLIGSKS